MTEIATIAEDTAKAPSQLAALKYFLAALVASATLQAIGVGFHHTVHQNIHLFHRLPLVLDGFRSVTFTQVFIPCYLVLTLIRYLAAMLGAAPMFTASSTRTDGRSRLVLAFVDTLLLYVALTLLYVASLSAQDSGAAIETATWILLVLSADALMCLLWILVLSAHDGTKIGFTESDAERTRVFNVRWLLITIVEAYLWVVFMFVEQNGGGDLDRACLFMLLLLTIAADFIASRTFWRMIVTGQPAASGAAGDA
jgi:hypothetical protein